VPNSRLAGLITRDGDTKRLVPLLFFEIDLPSGPPGTTPRLKGKLPAARHVLLWDARRKRASILLAPRSTDKELRFLIEWEEVAAAPR
jgi:hypothetical protein